MDDVLGHLSEGQRDHDEVHALGTQRQGPHRHGIGAAAYTAASKRQTDDIDWTEETRITIKERVAMSPDALTGMEAKLRLDGLENLFTPVFGRVSAWQNWIFQRPNAVGEKDARKVYGKGARDVFDWNRV